MVSLNCKIEVELIERMLKHFVSVANQQIPTCQGLLGHERYGLYHPSASLTNI